MNPGDAQLRRRLELLSRHELTQHQIERLGALLSTILPTNRFYSQKLSAYWGGELQGGKSPLQSLDELASWPFTFKQELIDAGHEGSLAANLTYPRERYVRFHQTSGMRGRPITVLDTAEDWQWWLDCWQYVLDAAEVRAGDCVLLAFSFGPFIGFWSAHDAAIARGCLVVPGGGMSSLGRLELVRTSGANVLCCTPSYALHLAEAATEHQIDAAALGVNKLILAGEPGGSLPAMRARIESAWNAAVVDHSGATEVGPWGYGDTSGGGLHVLESEFIAEFLSIESGNAAAEGEVAELVLTTLGRSGCPVIRYRTGDLVRPIWNHDRARRFVFLDGGVLGRSDDMMIVRGVNIFPSAIEQILRSFPEVVEYRLIVRKSGQMDHLLIEIEDRLKQPRRVAQELQLRLGLKVEVQSVSIGSLPRFEGKGKRFVDERKVPGNAREAQNP